MRIAAAILVALYLLLAGLIAAGTGMPLLAAWSLPLLIAKAALVAAALLAGVLHARPHWVRPALLLLLTAPISVPAWLLWRTALSRRASVWVVVLAYGAAVLLVLLPRLAPAQQFNVVMVLFILLFIVMAAVIASLFTWLFLKSFEALDRSFAYAFLYVIPLLGAPAWLLSRGLLPLVSAGQPVHGLWLALGLAMDGVLAAGLVVLLVARLLGRRLGPRHFVPLVAWKLLRSQQEVLTARARRLLRLRELVPTPLSPSGWRAALEVLVVAGVVVALDLVAGLLLPSDTWLQFARATSAGLGATVLACRYLSMPGRARLLWLAGAVLAGALAMDRLRGATLAGDGRLPPWLVLAVAGVPLLYLVLQSAVRLFLGHRRRTGRLPRWLDPSLSPVLETRIREGVGASVFVSVVGVAIGVWALIVVLSVMSGFSGEMQERIIRTKDHIMVKAAGEDRNLPGAVELARRLSGVAGVASASVYVEAEAMMSSTSNISATVTVRGIDRSAEALGFLEPSLVAGSVSLFRHPENLVPYPGLSGLALPEEEGVAWPGSEPDGAEPLMGLSDEPGMAGLPPLPGDDGGVLGALPAVGEGPEALADAPGLVAMPAIDEGEGKADEDLPELPDAPGLVAMPGIGEEASGGERPSPAAYFESSGRNVLPPIIIGQELARSLGAGVGSRINVISPDGDVGPMGVQPKARAFLVAGIFSTGMYEYDLKLAYMYLPDARRFFNLPDQITHIDVRLDHLGQADAVRARLAPELAGVTAEVLTWQEMNRNLFSALKLERVVMFLVLGFIILIASFNIVSSLIIIIRKRLSAIAILRTMGAASGEITRIFFLLGSAAGLFGIASGVMMGLSSCGIIEHLGITLPREYYIRSLPVTVDGWQVLQIAAAALLITAAAAHYPGRLAARVLLVEGLKDER